MTSMKWEMEEEEQEEMEEEEMDRAEEEEEQRRGHRCKTGVAIWHITWPDPRQKYLAAFFLAHIITYVLCLTFTSPPQRKFKMLAYPTNTQCMEPSMS